MKHLLLFFLLSCSLDGFSQGKSLQYCIKHHALCEVKCDKCVTESSVLVGPKGTDVDSNTIFTYGVKPNDPLILGNLATNSIFIGHLAGASAHNDSNIIIIGDFPDSSPKWHSDTLFYDRKFWYFSTPIGIGLLKYLDKQTETPVTPIRIIAIQEHIKLNYLEDIQKEMNKRNGKNRSFIGPSDGTTPDSIVKKFTSDWRPTMPTRKIWDSSVVALLQRVSDTLRATLIVYYEKGTMNILHTKPGFVVRQVGKEEVYLDDRKKVVKSPLEVFSYKLKR